nr:retrovirus-related Pol polyprotein from transposon TNT 1-94 [Tanacetum cinerariifolium]
MTDVEKTATLKMDVYKKAHSALLLCLDNKVLREVKKEDSAAGVWHSSKKLSEHVDEFNKLIGDLANIDFDIDDEDQALMLLTSLPSSYDNFMETLLYGRESLTLEDVLSSLNSCELKKKTDAKDDGDGLYVRGRSDHRDNQGRGSSRSKSKGFGMHSEGYDNGDLLMTMSEERFLEWIMDSGCSFHMTPRRDFLFDFKEFNGDTFCLVIIEHVPSGGQGRNLISLVTLDREGYTDESGEPSVGIQENKSLAQVWHKRLGHISEAGLHKLERKDVSGTKAHNRWSYRLCPCGSLGPSRVESMSGCRYFLLIVDDYLRRVWVHFLRHGNEAFSKFKEWKQLVEN